MSQSKPAARDRDRIIRFLESLADNPFQNGDMALTYWVDHGSEEVKVTRIEKAGQR